MSFLARVTGIRWQPFKNPTRPTIGLPFVRMNLGDVAMLGAAAYGGGNPFDAGSWGTGNIAGNLGFGKPFGAMNTGDYLRMAGTVAALTGGVGGIGGGGGREATVSPGQTAEAIRAMMTPLALQEIARIAETTPLRERTRTDALRTLDPANIAQSAARVGAAHRGQAERAMAAQAASLAEQGLLTPHTRAALGLRGANIAALATQDAITDMYSPEAMAGRYGAMLSLLEPSALAGATQMALGAENQAAAIEAQRLQNQIQARAARPPSFWEQVLGTMAALSAAGVDFEQMFNFGGARQRQQAGGS